MPTRRLFCLAALLVSAASAVSAQSPNQAIRAFPLYDNSGFPDLVVDEGLLSKSLKIEKQTFPSTACEIQEGTIAVPGTRRLLRLTVAVMNRGNGDVVLGNPLDGPYSSWFYYDSCHQHNHLKNFTSYALFELDGVTLVARTTKPGFCMRDSVQYDGVTHTYDADGNVSSNGGYYTCNSQGISVGWSDRYRYTLSGQWIDITGVAAGTYILRVTVNRPDGPALAEGLNLYSNVTSVRVRLP